MDCIGYVVTNKFIIIAFDSRLKITINEQKPITLNIPHAKKVHKIGATLGASVLGIPHKITDIYNFLLNLNDPQKTYDSTIEDLESIFNSDPDKLIIELKKLVELTTAYTDSTGELDVDKLTGSLGGDIDSLTMIKEALSMLSSNTGSAGLTQLLLFGRENGKNVFGEYKVLGFNFVGNKVEEIKEDMIFYELKCSVYPQDLIAEIADRKREELQQYIALGWEKDSELETILFQKCKEFLASGIEEVAVLKGRPTIQYYILNKQTNYEFLEPDINLTNISFHRTED